MKNVIYTYHSLWGFTGKEHISEKTDKTQVRYPHPPLRRSKLGNTSDGNLLYGQIISKNTRMSTHQSYRPYMWTSNHKDMETWSLPILTPVQEGRPYSPPPIPVAYIRPYVEPQVMYNPYFLWQLYSYKQTCNNNCIRSMASLCPQQ